MNALGTADSCFFEGHRFDWRGPFRGDENGEVAEARRRSGNGSPSNIDRARADSANDFVPAPTRALLESTYLAGLRKLGVAGE